MQTSPYSIYVNKRPLRVAFLVGDKPESLADIECIFTHNHERWGGRYNPIIITDGQTLADDWWITLEAVDPDIIVSFVPLGNELLASLRGRISPLHIQQPDPHWPASLNDRTHLHFDGLTFLPILPEDQAHLAKMALIKSTLVLLKTDFRNTDPVIRRFLDLNFGDYSNPIHAVSQALETFPKTEFQITDAASLAGPLKELSSFKSYVYPSQFCSTPENALPEAERSHLGEMFHVVIGDTPNDVAYFWNLQAKVPQWKRMDLNQVWVPLDVAKNPHLQEALSSWFQRQADPGGSGKGHVRFVSLSLSQAALEQIVAPLMTKLRVHRNVSALQDIEPPQVAEPFLSLDKLDRYQLTGTEERIKLQAPGIHSGPHLDEYWMADIYIEFRPERYPTIVGRTLWWQFPRLNNLTDRLFRKPSRVLRDRFPSVLMKRNEPHLTLSLPSDQNLLHGLGTLPAPTCELRGSPETRVSTGRRPYKRVRPSEKGRYLSGLLDLYGGLHDATDILESRYWRDMFDMLSGKNDRNDAERLKAIENKIKKDLGENPATFYQRADALEWMANYLLKEARSQRATSRDLDFTHFENRAKKEINDFRAGLQDAARWEYQRDDLMRPLRALTESGVLLMGLKEKCPSCGYRAWYHIDDAKQTLSCRGCNSSFPIPPEPIWHYQLNSLARAAHADHGLLPVVLVLGQMLLEAQSSFIFAPSLDLFENWEEGPVGDIDIAVVIDGKFTIGEVKQSVGLFDKATFTKMEEVARRLLPDVLLFASMDREPSGLVVEETGRLKAELQPLGIEVRWYRLKESTFEAKPVR